MIFIQANKLPMDTEPIARFVCARIIILGAKQKAMAAKEDMFEKINFCINTK